MFILCVGKNRLPIIILAAALLMATLLFGFVLPVWCSRPVLTQNYPITSGSAAKKRVSIIVNVDWGEDYLPELLSILKQRNVSSTFFITGRWAQANANLVKAIARDGHEIGNHGFSHPHVDQLSLDENMQEIRETEEVLFQLTGKHTIFYAPPYGEYNATVIDAANRCNLRLVLWSIDTVDWQNPSPAWIVDRVRSLAHNGAIILVHPTPVTVRALPEVIDSLKQQGYEIIPLEKLLSE